MMAQQQQQTSISAILGLTAVSNSSMPSMLSIMVLGSGMGARIV